LFIDGEGTTPVEAGEVLDPPADGSDSSQTLHFDDQQVTKPLAFIKFIHVSHDP
jgi:hypothetical protein